MNQFIKMTQINLEEMNSNIEASMKNLKNQIVHLSKQVEARSNGGFNGNMFDNPRNYEVEREF